MELRPLMIQGKSHLWVLGERTIPKGLESGVLEAGPVIVLL